jgi:lipoyl(octanoyl) transferase
VTRALADPRRLRAEPTSAITVVHANEVPYLTAWAWQRELARRRAADEIGDVLLLLEHPRVYTLGRRADETNLVFDAAERDRRGIELHRIDRGGDVTYHGPGQLVGYPILRLAGPRVVDHVRALEAINIEVAASYGIAAERIDGLSGVWVDGAKLTAVGVHVSARGVTTHGWATNVTTDLSDFGGIVPCGIADRPVTSLDRLGVATDVAEVAERTAAVVGEVLDAEVARADLDALDLGSTACDTLPEPGPTT